MWRFNETSKKFIDGNSCFIPGALMALVDDVNSGTIVFFTKRFNGTASISITHDFITTNI